MKCPNCLLEIPECLNEKQITAIKDEIKRVDEDLLFYESQYPDAKTKSQKQALDNCKEYSIIKRDILKWVLNQ